MQEIWKEIPNYPNYQVSNYGKVKRIKFYSNIYKKYYDKELILKEKTNRYGYKVVGLGCGKRSSKKNIAVHRLVAQLFVSNPNNYNEVNHIDGNKNNNRADNLEWCTRSENMLHAYKLGLHKPIQEYIKLKKEAM